MSSPSRSVRRSSVREASRFFRRPRRLELARKAAPVLAALLILPAATAAGQQCAPAAVSPAIWNSPLDRRVSLHTHDSSLRDALDRVAAATQVKLSYTSEALPLETTVCAAFDSAALGDVLNWLLRGTAVKPLGLGDDHVVLATTAADERPAGAARTLDRVVVTGGSVESSARPLTVAMNVVTGAQLSRYAGGNLMQAMSDVVPGLWVWQSAPTSLLAHYGSIRGSSSFGSSYPKIYVDGIEIANPLLMTQFTPETVERIEVIRGPQGAALYGSDAISGVINIVTRHDGSNGGPTTVVRSAVGTASSAYVGRGAITQDHAVTVRHGSSAQSASGSFTSSGVGEYLPNAFARSTTAGAGFRIVRDRLIATGTARIFASESADPSSPFFRDSASLAQAGLAEPQSVHEYTVGGSATIVQNDRWTHALVAGFDGSRLSSLTEGRTSLESGSTPDLGTVSGNANLATVRASSVGKFGDPDELAATLTLAAENSMLDFRANSDAASTQAVDPLGSMVQRWTTAGAAQANLSWKDEGYVTGGLRLERNDAFGGGSTVSLLPMLGAAVIHDWGPRLTMKLRSAYGRGIRPATTPVHETAWFDSQRAHMMDLSPEQQSGIEVGVDFFLGKTLGLQITRFDQLASGLIQRVAYVAYNERSVGPAANSGYDPQQPTTPDDRHIAYVLQNVGEITNRGWELRSDVSLGALDLTGTFSTVDSRVRRVAQGYVGDLRAGDRMLEVPASTGSFSASWIGRGWSGSLTASRSWNWIDYDRVALAGAITNSTQPDAQLVGGELRNYWLKYAGVTRLRASIGRALFRGLSFNVSGENLLNRQHGEPDNITVVPGRTLSLGLKAVM
ncbi:MAG TPA: TonB-dependent receptor [Gemmatimonadaceae bacterium]|nr:TonB-dependent receptor [Gemmatimonadaceae bacterium]